MKKILVIDAHPNEKSLCRALADSYLSMAESSGFDTKRLTLRNLEFDLNLHQGYHQIQELEPDLVQSQEQILWCDHLVIVYPIWWGTMPALLKGFFDRCWLPGFAFQYHKKDPFWDKLLKGRSARIIVTSDAPYLYNFFIHWSAPYRVVKKAILAFCGFRPVKMTAFGGIKNLSEAQIKQTLTKVETLGQKGL
ncbi:MAG: NAD(P)H-dependent oxidoreductase [Bdellovibrionales bacterium]|nr:NAD(P)H-dependent oxidoreductase [Bdellovibrionales bacterium]